MSDIVKQILARPIQLTDQVIKASDEAASFKQECLELKAKTAKLADLLRQAARSSSELYERPTRRIIDDTEQVLEKALLLTQKCRSNGLLKRAFTIIHGAAFRMMMALLENSIGDVSWLLRVSGGSGDGDDGGEGYLGLPPIAANEPILCLIWEQIAILSIGSVEDRADAAASLVSLAGDNFRYGKLIIEEGGVGPLLKLLKEGKTVEGQENAARAIGLLGRDPESVEHMVLAGVCSVFAKVLKEGPMKVQAMVAWAVSELANHYSACQDIFAQYNAVRLLVGHLAFETVEEHSKYSIATHKASLHHAAVVVTTLSQNHSNSNSDSNSNNVRYDRNEEHPQIAHPLGQRSHSPSRLHNVVASAQAQAKANSHQQHTNHNHNNSHSHSLAGSRMRVRELEDPATKTNMKAMAARALWHLVKGNYGVCRSICESRALLCFAVLLEKGEQEIQFNSAMALMEITAVAEKYSDLRRSAFKPTTPSCKAVVDQLLRVIEKADSYLLVPCIRAVGNLARTFRATENQMIAPLVRLLDENEDEVVLMEAAIALTKFAATENFLHVDHSKEIIDAGGVKHLIQLVYFGGQPVKGPALELLAYIACHVPDSQELAQNEVLTVLEWASKQSTRVQDEDKETLLMEAKSKLELYQSRVSR